MKESTVYIKAARLVHSDVKLPSCWAVRRAGGRWAQVFRYQKFMLDDELDVTLLWGRGHEYSEETRKARVLLLCFMAAIAESSR